MADPVTLDFSKAQPIQAAQAPAPQQGSTPRGITHVYDPETKGIHAVASSAVSLDFNQAQPVAKTPEDKQSQTRQMLVSGLTGMPTPNMSESDKASFESGKAAGAVSNVATAAGVTGVTGLAELLPAARAFMQSEAGKELTKLVLKHTGEKLLTGAGVGVGYGAIHKAAELLGLIDKK
jgi:hypothetical protein